MIARRRAASHRRIRTRRATSPGPSGGPPLSCPPAIFAQVLANAPELLVAPRDPLGLAEPRYLAELRSQRLAEPRRRRLRIPMRATERLLDDAVHDPEAGGVLREHLELFGGVRGERPIAPEDRRAPLGRDHAVRRELHHHHAVGDPERE